MRARPLLLTVLFVALAAVAPGAAQAPAEPGSHEPRAFVLDAAAKAVVALDVASATALGTVPLEGEPAALLRTKDGSRVLALDRGPGKLTARFGYHPSGKSAVSVLDVAGLKVLSRLELGWGLGPRSVSGDGRRLTVFCPGYRSQKPADTLPRELVTVDLTTSEVTGRVAIEREVETLLFSEHDEIAIAFSRSETPKKGPAIPAELRFIDLERSSLVSILKLEGSPVSATLSPDGQHVYLLETGRPPKKKDKGINGRVQVVSVASRLLDRNLDAGSQPRGLVLDRAAQQVLILSDGPVSPETNKPSGELRVIRGAELAATLTTAQRPLFLRVAPDQQRLYVIGADALTTVDYRALQVVGQMPLASVGGGLLAKHQVSEFAVTADGTRGFALYAQSSRLVVLNLETSRSVASITTGRGGVKFGKFMAAVALTAASAAAGASMASAMGSPYYMYNVYSVAPANTSIALRPDGKFAYVLNTQTNDVTIVSAKDGTIIDKIGGGGHRLELLSGGNVLAVVGSSLRLIDTTTQQALPELPLGGSLFDVSLTTDRRYAVALVDKAVVCLDGASGAILGSATGFKRPTAIVFAGTDDVVARR
jgi:DNA-binding beta-propeller fold protein YncE